MRPRILSKVVAFSAAMFEPATTQMRRSTLSSSYRLRPAVSFRSRNLALAVFAALPALVCAAEFDQAETRVRASTIEGQEEVDIRASGNVRIDRQESVLTSDAARMDLVSKDVTAEGNVLLLRNQDSIRGPRARVNVDTWFGEVETPQYSLRRLAATRNNRLPSDAMRRSVSGSGAADQIMLEGENKYRLINASYSSCPAPNPDWYLKVSELKLDYDREKGEAQNGVVVFKGVPILYAPWMEFPLNGSSQSGFLPPTLGNTSNTGADVTLPYYLSLAPNYDVTLAPRLMSRRGLQLGTEGRYLTPYARGTLRTEYLPKDLVTNASRGLLTFNHQHSFGAGLSGFIDFNAVSHKAYFADLSSKITSTSQANLNRQIVLNYGNGTWLSSTLQMQRYQNLTGDTLYSRLPQLSMQLRQPDLNGFSLQVPTELTSFTHPTIDKGRRFVAYPQIAYPLQNAAFYLTPKFGLHVSRYALDRRTTSGDESLSRVVPSLSLDGGVSFEREFKWAGRDQVQTLEPRMYYVRTPYRDQSAFPVFDSARADFNFAQIFSENVYTGQDRIADANQLTAGVQSRLIAADTGEQWLGMALAQRYYMRDQRVTLPKETPRTGRVADILAAISGKAYRHILLDAALQYDPRDDRVQKTSLGIRYQPDFAKVISVSYRFRKKDSRDLDITSQWPLWGQWYGVGRYNRNLRDRTTSEALAGLEYKAGCWVFRGVWQTLLNTQGRNNAYFFQLELNDFAAIGNNPVSLLRRNVGGYGKINEPPANGQMFSNEP